MPGSWGLTADFESGVTGREVAMIFLKTAGRCGRTAAAWYNPYFRACFGVRNLKYLSRPINAGVVQPCNFGNFNKSVSSHDYIDL